MRPIRAALCLPLAAAFVLAACASQPGSKAPPASAACPPPAPASTPASAAQTQALPVPEPIPAVRNHAPFRYTVRSGDTLWDISARFFQSPWLWPEIWYENPYIQNPHLIYPGDVITFAYIAGHPALTVSRHGTTVATTVAGTRMLHPQIIRTPLAQAVPTIPYDDIAALLSKPRVMAQSEYDAAPHILRSADGRLLTAAPGLVYARGLSVDDAVPGTLYAVVRQKKRLSDPESGRVLGYEVLYLGRARVTVGGDPATLKLIESSREIRAGDRLVAPDTEVVPAQFPLHVPCAGIEAEIIDVIGGLSEVGQYQVIVIDRGEQAGLRVGETLAVYTHGQTVRDPYAGDLSKSVRLPDQRSGEVVVFRVFPEVSFALVMRALRPIKIGDLITAP